MASTLSLLLAFAATIPAIQADTGVTAIWQAGTCDNPQGETRDISPNQYLDICNIYKAGYFPNGDPRGHVQVTITGQNGFVAFHLPPSEENQEIHCGELLAVFKQSGCYDDVYTANDAMTGACSPGNCFDNRSGNATESNNETANWIRGEEQPCEAAVEQKRTAPVLRASPKFPLLPRDDSCDNAHSECDDCIPCYAQGVRVSPSLACPLDGQGCELHLQQSVTITDSFTITAGTEGVFTATVETTHSVSVMYGNENVFVLNPGESGYVQYEAPANCGTMTVLNGDGGMCAAAKGVFVVDNSQAGQYSFVRQN